MCQRKLEGGAGARPRGLVYHQEAEGACADSRGKPPMGLRRERPARCVLERAV